MAILTVLELAAMLGIDPDQLLEMKDLQGTLDAAEGGLAVVDFTVQPAPGPDAPPVMRRRSHWGHAFSFKNPLIKRLDE